MTDRTRRLIATLAAASTALPLVLVGLRGATYLPLWQTGVAGGAAGATLAALLGALSTRLEGDRPDARGELA